MASSSSDEPALALPAPTTAVDALPYVDAQYLATKYIQYDGVTMVAVQAAVTRSCDKI